MSDEKTERATPSYVDDRASASPDDVIAAARRGLNVAAASAVPVHPDIEAKIEAWFANAVQGSGVAQALDTALYNRLHEAKEALKRDLSKMFTPASPN